MIYCVQNKTAMFSAAGRRGQRCGAALISADEGGPIMKKKTSETVILDGHYYTIAAPNGRVLEVANYNPESGAAIQLWDYAGAQWQQWELVCVDRDTYRICNRFTGKAVDLCLGGTADGTWLHQWECNTGKSQLWKLENTPDGFVRFRSVLAGKYLDLYQAFSGNGARAQIWSDHEGENQRWLLKDVTDKQSIRPSEAQMEKKLKEQVEEAAKEAKKEARKTGRKAAPKKSAAKTKKTTAAAADKPAKRTCRTKKPAGEQ